ncbi:MAG: hypothetical protein GX303_05565 [Clostridiales bacterium]|nr:hypothetical protein [Clostridiales bacterium]
MSGKKQKKQNKKQQSIKANNQETALKDAGNNQWTSSTADLTDPMTKRRERRDGPGGERGRGK